MIWMNLLALAFIVLIPGAPGSVMVWKADKGSLLWWLGVVLLGFSAAIFLIFIIFMPAA